MASMSELVTASATRVVERRVSGEVVRTAPAAIVVYDRPVSRWRGPAPDTHSVRCLPCTEDRVRESDGKFPLAVAVIELPAWCWEGPVCAGCLTQAREAARSVDGRCHVRLIDDRPPAAPGEVYRTVPRPRSARRVGQQRPSNETIEISGDYGR
jgi:hypothetical protein